MARTEKVTFTNMCMISDGRGNVLVQDRLDPDWPGIAFPGGHVERLLENFSNLYCDCSADSGYTALSRDIKYTKKLVETYPDRFVYGRDGFGNKHSELFNDLELSGEILEGFYHKNIERLLEI